MSDAETPRVGVVMGSSSDWETMRHASETLQRLGVAHECRVVSAHRTPSLLADYGKSAEERGLRAIIAGAGGAAHLPGMLAAFSLVPVLGVPVESAALKGLDSLLSIVQMPGGVPVGTLAIGKAGAINAALLAAAFLANDDPALRERLRQMRAERERQVLEETLPPGVAVSQAIAPGAAVGVLGSGQLGRMFAIAARRMGYRVHTFSPDSDTPTGQVADVEINAPYEDLDQVRAFARGVRVITFEFENVPSATVEAALAEGPVRPGGHVLHTTQQRLREKSFLAGAGFPVTPFAPIRSDEDLAAAAARVGLPAVLKSAAFGYDGKGQARVSSAAELQKVWERLGRAEAILEAFVDFSLELSVVAARGISGDFAHYGAVENHHRNHILDLSIAPARVPPAVAAEAVEIARAILEKLDVVGVLCVEFFLTRSGALLVNELAPRPHNSGHFTFDACVTSQFEQQLRAVCGLPLGSTTQLCPAVMANLLGDAWSQGEPRFDAVCGLPAVKLHLYGKTEPRPGRKMGHLTALAPSIDEALAQIERARGLLDRGS